jgi:hypothetical protein
VNHLKNLNDFLTALLSKNKIQIPDRAFNEKSDPLQEAYHVIYDQ